MAGRGLDLWQNNVNEYLRRLSCHAHQKLQGTSKNRTICMIEDEDDNTSLISDSFIFAMLFGNKPIRLIVLHIMLAYQCQGKLQIAIERQRPQSMLAIGAASAIPVNASAQNCKQVQCIQSYS